jgi:hypothetical protein
MTAIVTLHPREVNAVWVEGEKIGEAVLGGVVPRATIFTTVPVFTGTPRNSNY